MVMAHVSTTNCTLCVLCSMDIEFDKYCGYQFLGNDLFMTFYQFIFYISDLTLFDLHLIIIFLKTLALLFSKDVFFTDFLYWMFQEMDQEPEVSSSSDHSELSDYDWKTDLDDLLEKLIKGYDVTNGKALEEVECLSTLSLRCSMMNLLKVINQNIPECDNAEYKYSNPKEDKLGKINEIVAYHKQFRELLAIK